MPAPCRLPPPARPVACYVPVVVAGNLAFVAGHGPLRADGTPATTGALRTPGDIARGREAARLTARNLLASLDAALADHGGLAAVAEVLAARSFLLAGPGFRGHDQVAAAAWETFAAHLGRGSPGATTTTVVVGGAVFDLPVTVDAVFALDH